MQQQPSAPIPQKKKSKIRWGKIILWVLVLTFVTIQFFQPDKNNTSIDKSQSIAVITPISDTVNALLQSACYDCHSNNTRYPWYTNIQPVGWWLRHHINEGKQHLNFDEFVSYSTEKQQDKLEEIVKSQQDGWMPLDSYTWIHKDAKLTDGQRQQIIAWAKEVEKSVSNKGEQTSSK